MGIIKSDINYWLEKIYESIQDIEIDAKVQSDWAQSDNTKADFIKNKPTIPSAQIQSDWNQADNTKADFIKNKPSIPVIPTIGTIVEGSVVDTAFTPAEGAASFADVLALIAETPSVVYLKYSDTYDMVVLASASLLKTSAGKEWAAPVGE